MMWQKGIIKIVQKWGTLDDGWEKQTVEKYRKEGVGRGVGLISLC